LSRATAKVNIKILVVKKKDKGKEIVNGPLGKGKANGSDQTNNTKKRKRDDLVSTMKNIVYKEVLTA
jgi:hypothetical protein